MSTLAPTTAGTKSRTRDSGTAASAGPLSPDELRKIDAYWCDSNYLSVGQIYLLDKRS
jgi:xylulose-5-phosphate/fructose-6-phosphate phosphoketolase